nr:AAA family ATPase [Paenibacillus pasadenensis]
MVFTGNPGTGKTTAARLIGEVFTSMGLLKSPKKDGVSPFVEIHQADIAHPHVGESEKIMLKKFQLARGGVLFIDEAYSFMGKASHNTDGKLVAIIVQQMEDMRDEIIVIAAGYPKDMNKFLDFNPGLRSRFNTTIHFPDYSVQDMLHVAAHMCKEREYQMTAEFGQALGMRLAYEMGEKGFGNARTVRNIMEAAIKRQSSRVAKLPQIRRTDLFNLTGPDMPPAPQSTEDSAAELERLKAKRDALDAQIKSTYRKLLFS